MVHKMAKYKNFENLSYIIPTIVHFNFLRGKLNIFIFTHFMGDNMKNFSKKNQIFAQKMAYFGQQKNRIKIR